MHHCKVRCSAQALEGPKRGRKVEIRRTVFSLTACCTPWLSCYGLHRQLGMLDSSMEAYHGIGHKGLAHHEIAGSTLSMDDHAFWHENGERQHSILFYQGYQLSR